MEILKKFFFFSYNYLFRVSYIWRRTPSFPELSSLHQQESQEDTIKEITDIERASCLALGVGMYPGGAIFNFVESFIQLETIKITIANPFGAKFMRNSTRKLDLILHNFIGCSEPPILQTSSNSTLLIQVFFYFKLHEAGSFCLLKRFNTLSAVPSFHNLGRDTLEGKYRFLDGA